MDGGNGYGNRNHIGIETCYSKSGGSRYDEAETNMIKIAAQLLKDNGWGISKVKKHQDWSGKNCPHRILARTRGWQGILNAIQKELTRIGGKKESTISKAPSKPVSKPASKPSKQTWKSVSGNWTGQTLKRGDKGEPVRQLQNKLANNNPPFYPNKEAKNNGVDSYYGADTEDAVRRYQSTKAGVDVDGMAGKQVYNALGGKKAASKKPVSKKLTAPTGTLRRGHRGAKVRQLQEALNKANYKVGKVDGIYGAKTEDAVRRVQLMHETNKSYIDGIYGNRTRGYLNRMI